VQREERDMKRKESLGAKVVESKACKRTTLGGKKIKFVSLVDHTPGGRKH